MCKHKQLPPCNIKLSLLYHCYYIFFNIFLKLHNNQNIKKRI
nr:MAG TPA: hypothetical protein [Caudoviricetes sp.]